MEDSTYEHNGVGAAWVIQGCRRPWKKEVQEGRNRASPARLVKLNKSLDQYQRNLIETYFLRGILKIEATMMPSDLTRWVMYSYDPNNECIVVPCMGEIPVIAESVHHTLCLRNSGEEVFYGWDGEAIFSINSRYDFKNGSAPEITSMYTMIEEMKGRADDDFMRAWMIVVVSSSMCPTMSLHIIP
ncbi:hypothetical protein ZWY2020_020677 [Hordeum vulgare]|nr:hypothetical protein ZWY2020_020677 [Hordeum vulgare]